MTNASQYLPGDDGVGVAGTYNATVTRVDTAGVYVTVPRLTGDNELGPCQASADVYVKGDAVLVAALEDRSDEVNVVGRAGARRFATPAEVATSSAAAQAAAIASANTGIAGVYAVPTGAVLSFAGAAGMTPAGWLECDGTAYLSSSYTALSNLLGTGPSSLYGAAAAGYFTVPDLRARVAIGASATAGYPRGQNDGLAVGTRSLTNTHAHGINTQGSHAHGISSGGGHNHGGTGTTALGQVGTTTATGGFNRLVGPDPHSHTIPSDGVHDHGLNTGQGGSHDHGSLTANGAATPGSTTPYTALGYIIRT